MRLFTTMLGVALMLGTAQGCERREEGAIEGIQEEPERAPKPSGEELEEESRETMERPGMMEGEVEGGREAAERTFRVPEEPVSGEETEKK